MLSQQILGYPIKYYVAILTIALWLCILTYTLIRNPSTTDANHRMVMMKADMTEILANGGAIVHRHENAKFGTALLFALIRKDSWSYELREQNIATLVDMGWKLLPATSASFCKHGVLAEIQQNAGDYENIPTVLISMKYNAATLKACR